MALTLEGLEKWYTQTVKMKYGFMGETPPEPIPMPDVTTIDGLLEGVAKESENALISVAQNAGRYHDYDEAYTLQLPAEIKRWYGVKKIGGRTVVWNQLNRLSQSTGTVNDVTFTLDKDALTVTCSGIASAKASKSVTSYASVSGHVYYLKGCPQGGAVDKYWMDTATGTGEDTGNGFVFTSTHNGTRYIVCRIGNGVDATGVVFKPILIDLTLMFGAGNEPTTAAECNAMFPKDFYAYTTGELLSAGVTAIVSKDANNDTVETITIPAEIQTLTGYGMSCPNNVNHIDFEEKKFVQNVGFVDLSTLTFGYGPSVGWSATLPNVKNPADDDTAFNGLSATLKVTDRNTQATAFSGGTDAGMVSVAGGKVYVGTGSISIVPSGTLIYELDEPVETDVSAYLTDVDLNVEAGGTITFENQTDCNIPVPIDVEYIA